MILQDVSSSDTVPGYFPSNAPELETQTGDDGTRSGRARERAALKAEEIAFGQAVAKLAQLRATK